MLSNCLLRHLRELYSNSARCQKVKDKNIKKTFRDAILDLVKLFISRGASINAPDSLGVTPFMTAVKER